MLTYQNVFGKSGISDKDKPLNLKNRIIYWNAGNKYLIHLTYVQVNTIWVSVRDIKITAFILYAYNMDVYTVHMYQIVTLKKKSV